MNGTAGNGSASALFCAYDRRQRDAYETARSGDSTPWSVQLAPRAHPYRIQYTEDFKYQWLSDAMIGARLSTGVEDAVPQE